MLKALQEEGIHFEYISGTSSGSIVATLYSCGYTPEEIYEIFRIYCKKIGKLDLKNIMKLIVGLIIKREIVIDGLIDGKRINKLMNEKCLEKGVWNIQDIKMPLLIPAVNLNNGSLYIFSSEQKRSLDFNSIKYIYDVNIGKAVQASCSYPGVFSPCKYEDTELIDGGTRENIPWKETKSLGADRVLSVVFTSEMDTKKKKNIIEVISDSLDILSRELFEYEMIGAECILNIKSKKINLLDCKKMDYLYELGYKTAKNNMEEIKQCLYGNDYHYNRILT